MRSHSSWVSNRRGVHLNTGVRYHTHRDLLLREDVVSFSMRALFFLYAASLLTARCASRGKIDFSHHLPGRSQKKKIGNCAKITSASLGGSDGGQIGRLFPHGPLGLQARKILVFLDDSRLITRYYGERTKPFFRCVHLGRDEA